MLVVLMVMFGVLISILMVFGSIDVLMAMMFGVVVIIVLDSRYVSRPSEIC